MNDQSVSQNTAKSKESLNNLVEDQQKWKIENITVIKPPLLKRFYWQSLDIEGLNNKLLTDDYHIEHDLYLPTRQLNSTPLKIVFWLRNLTKNNINLQLKRIQNCQCAPMKTRVGFNQFRNLYHCPHRRLINISEELFDLKPNELVAMTMVAYYYIFGEYVLSYQLSSISDSRIVMLHFHVDITIFDPVKSILTTELIPVNIKEYRYLSQPIWIRNITMQNLQFMFKSRERGLRLINPNFVVPRQSVWPLIVEYRPSDLENNLELVVNFDKQFNISCSGYLEDRLEDHDKMPLHDYECSEFLYVIYPNKLAFNCEINEERTLMVAVHNKDQKCMEFQWQTYTISDYFSFTFEPSKFSLKPHHSKLCVVRVKSFENPLHFKCIPGVLEVHRIFDKSTQIAKEHLSKIESPIDDPKWKENSYLEHVLLHIDLKVNFPEKVIVEMEQPTESSVKQSNNTTIFEKLFWEYLSNTNYMRDTSQIPKNLTYEEVLCQDTKAKMKENTVKINKKEALNLLSFLTAEACRELSKNYRFIPQDILDDL